ncbi:hypothetical protein NH26_21195 [Flammeovirga pacifica]|nr:hypothetical protein NH26_21195 [Flammeovirga pacifica]
MRCKFCFAKFQDVKSTILPKGHLKKEQTLEIVEQLAEYGFQKITFVGGEPTLCPWISELIKKANLLGMTTMIVTNGSNLSKDFLVQNQSYLDWITLSIDSINSSTNKVVGRSTNSIHPDRIYYNQLIQTIYEYGYRLKINTVVTKANLNEDLNDFVNDAKPERWKVFQVLPVRGQNDNDIDELLISEKEFNEYVNRHSKNKFLITETNTDMTNTYVMVDPAGRFFNNQNGNYMYSDHILEVGVQKAFEEMGYNYDKFIDRKGIYQWK